MTPKTPNQQMPDFSKALPVFHLPNRAVPDLLVYLPDGRVYRGEDLDGTGACGWIYVGDVDSIDLKIAVINAEWPPWWLPGVKPPVRVTRRLLRDLGLNPDQFGVK